MLDTVPLHYFVDRRELFKGWQRVDTAGTYGSFYRPSTECSNLAPVRHGVMQSTVLRTESFQFFTIDQQSRATRG